MTERSFGENRPYRIAAVGAFLLVASVSTGWSNDIGAPATPYHHSIEIGNGSGGWDAKPEVADISCLPTNAQIRWELSSADKKDFVFLPTSFQYAPNPNDHHGSPVPFYDEHVDAKSGDLTVFALNAKGHYYTYDYTLFVVKKGTQYPRYYVDPQIKNGSAALCTNRNERHHKMRR